MNKVSVNISRIRLLFAATIVRNLQEIEFCVKNSWKVTFVLTVHNLKEYDSPLFITLQYEIQVVSSF